jgi:hypothetical protein
MLAGGEISGGKRGGVRAINIDCGPSALIGVFFCPEKDGVPAFVHGKYLGDITVCHERDGGFL